MGFTLSRRALRVIKAFSSGLRLKILNLLLLRGQLSYTEIMNELKLNPVRDAGRFAYHLKLLLESDLIELDPSTKRYRLTDLGRRVIDVTEDIESKVSPHRRMLVRTSKASLEEFDRNKIVNSLVKEANVPLEEAQRVAREAERRLQRFKTRYLTAPLIREVVNAVLLERGLEEYRHKLTRLGLPVYDVTNLIKSASGRGVDVDSIVRSAGEKVFAEYTLLNVFPRDVADAHLSGTFHIENLGNWILKPDGFVHDLRFLFRYGIRFADTYSTKTIYPPPKSYEEALQSLVKLVYVTAGEVVGEQALPHFNVFLAPFIKGLKEEEILEGVRGFLTMVNGIQAESGPGVLSIGLDLSIPESLAEEEAYGMGGEALGSYAEFTDESLTLASAVMEAFLEHYKGKPGINVIPIVNLQKENLNGEDGLLYKAHELAAETSLPLFADQSKSREDLVYMASGVRFNCDWTGDWELDTLRVGVLGRVDLNLPRLYYDSREEGRRFEVLLDERVEMAIRALEIKYRAINQRGGEGVIPFLFHTWSGDRYFHLRNSIRVLSIVGLNEVIAAILDRELKYGAEEAHLAERILKQTVKRIEENAGVYNARVRLSAYPHPEAAERLARLDVERYGWSKVKVQGDKEHPIYTDSGLIPFSSDIPLKTRLRFEGLIQKYTGGGHLAVIQLEDVQHEPEELLSATITAIKDFNLNLFTYNLESTYCLACGNKSYGSPFKCPKCGSADTLIYYSRLFDRYLPLKYWTEVRAYHRRFYKKYKLKSEIKG